MPNLFFKQTKIPVSMDGERQIWVRAVDLARALGYEREDKVSRIYRRHADEFTDSMTRLVQFHKGREFEPRNGVQILPRGNPAPLTRVFSLRGCHLIAMLARTPVAKDFRKWVLDVLDYIATRLRDDERMRSFFNWPEVYNLRAYAAGHALGQMSRLKLERQKLILEVCGMLEKAGMTRKLIADTLSISTHTVRYIARRYYRGMALFGPVRNIAAKRVDSLLAQSPAPEVGHEQ